MFNPLDQMMGALAYRGQVRQATGEHSVLAGRSSLCVQPTGRVGSGAGRTSVGTRELNALRELSYRAKKPLRRHNAEKASHCRTDDAG